MRSVLPLTAAVLLALVCVPERDLASGRFEPASLATHHPTPAGPASDPDLPRLTACGRALCAGEARFRWDGVTAFGLADLVADGRRGDAAAFLAWARDTGFTIVRVLTMLPDGGWMDLSPADGRQALPVVCQLARDHGMYVQAVALANTGEKSGRFRDDTFLREQVREIARACHAAGNCVLEIANEPYHGSQARLADPALMRRLQGEVPGDLPVTWGAAHDDRTLQMAGGTFVVVHLDRSGPWWTRVVRAADLAYIAARSGKFVVDNEPIGAAERPERSRRDATPKVFFAQGVASRLVDAGATFHCEDCLHARVPGPIQRECAAAFVAGRRLVPPNVRLQPGGHGSVPAVATLAEGARGSLLDGVDGSRAYVLVMGPVGESQVLWSAGWRDRARVGERDDAVVWSATR